MIEAGKAKKKTPRALPREVRRMQLIRATMKCIASRGLSGTTMAQVTSEAGLSLGIANLHFESKEKLLIATLQHVADEYNSGHAAILASNKYQTITARIEAILQFDFSAKVMTRDKIAVWFAFWGEAKSRPTYQRICSRKDFLAEDAIREVFQATIDEGEYPDADAAMLASGYTAIVDGLWLNMLIAPRQQNRDQAKRVARHYLHSAFPEHIESGD